jgi:hypothetical protein
MAKFKRGHPRYGGRKLGQRNRATIERELAVAEAGARMCEALGLTESDVANLMPLDVLLMAMRRSVLDGDKAGAVQAAVAAAPFCHARLSSADIKVHHELGEKSDLELEAEILDLQERLRLTGPDGAHVG